MYIFKDIEIENVEPAH